MEAVVLRHRASCSVCGSRLPPRTEAWWDAEQGVTICDTCYRFGLDEVETPMISSTLSSPQARSTDPLPAPMPASLPGPMAGPTTGAVTEQSPPPGAEPVPATTGGPAPAAHDDGPEGPLAFERPEASSSSAPARPRIKSNRRPKSTASPKGSVGSPDRGSGPASAPGPAPLVYEKPPPRITDARVDRVTAALDAAANQGIAARHHRLVGSWGSMVDHLVVSPNGLWVVIDQPYPEGKVERRDVGDWFTPEPRLFVGDKDRSDVTRRVNAIDESVGAVLAGSILADVPRYRVV